MPSPIPRKRLQELSANLLALEGVSTDVEVSLLFCDDETIRQLNREYRGKDQATDVLSFGQDGASPPGEPRVLGDIVISLETAARQAAARGQSLADEVAWLFVHGLLHLLGYEDETESGAREMERRARRVLGGSRVA